MKEVARRRSGLTRRVGTETIVDSFVGRPLVPDGRTSANLMDPLRRLIFLALFASVVVAEPTQLRALTAAMSADAAAAKPSWVPGGWARRIAILLRTTIRPAIINGGPRRRARWIDLVRSTPVALPQVAATRALVSLWALHLPPPR